MRGMTSSNLAGGSLYQIAPFRCFPEFADLGHVLFISRVRQGGVAKALILALFCVGTLNFFLLGWKLLKEGEKAKVGIKAKQ
jgi:hypothetical protein